METQPKEKPQIDTTNFKRPATVQPHRHSKKESEPESQPTTTVLFTRTHSRLNDEQFIILAETYKNYTCLWNENDTAYKFGNRRREAMDNLLAIFNEQTKLNLMKRDLDKEISLMRKICSIEKRQKLMYKKSKKKYKPKCPYYEHIAYLEIDVNPYECTICGQLLNGPNMYKIHLASHDGSLPFKCNICGHGFKFPNLLIIHLRRHVQDYIHNCKICNKPCATSTELRDHELSHTGEKPFICDICGTGFRLKCKFKEHMDRHEEKRRYKCKYCPKAFYNGAGLREHISVHVKVRDKICNVCNKGFTTGKQLRQHRYIHDAEKRYLCKICGKRFAQYAGLKGHMNSHGTSLSTIPTDLEQVIEEIEWQHPLKILQLAYNNNLDSLSVDNQENVSREWSDFQEDDGESSTENLLTLELIEEYRNLPALWDRSNKGFHNEDLKRHQFHVLFTKYREMFPDGDKNDLRETINILRSNYFKECQQVASHTAPKPYYFDAMNFLRHSEIAGEPPSSIHNLKVEETWNANCENFKRTNSILNDMQFIELAEIYRKHHCLWNDRDIAYRFANRRREAVQNILDEFNTKCGLNLEKSILEREILQMRRVCSSEKKRKLYCQRNNIIYKPLCPYYDQIEFLEIDVNPFECEKCGKRLVNLGRYKTHMAAHDGTLPFKCHICGHGFQLGTNLTVHLRRHVQDYTYSCKVCNKPCATTTELKIHMRNHTGEKPYVCEVCGKSFRLNSEFREHMERHEKRPRHKCEICSRAFYTKGKVKEHMSTHLQIRDKICDICNKGFTTKKQLRQHKHIHDSEKRFICKLCGKRFSQSAGLSGHMKSHGRSLAAKDPETE